MTVRIGIVGSRRRCSFVDMKNVFSLVKDLRERFGSDLVLVSGGCPKCADEYARDAARSLGVPIREFHVDLNGVKSKHEFTKRAFSRNRSIAELSDQLYALVHYSRTGGTENTISQFHEFMETDSKRRLFTINESWKIDEWTNKIDVRSTWSL